jgi:hypothetical protein
MEWNEGSDSLDDIDGSSSRIYYHRGWMMIDGVSIIHVGDGGWMSIGDDRQLMMD